MDKMIARPGAVIALSLLPFIAFIIGMTKVVKDPSVDAFVTVDNPAAIARDQARELFGVEDPVIIIFARDAGEDAFWPPLLGALARFTDEARAISGVDGDIISLASERAILASDTAIEAPLIVDAEDIDPAKSRALSRSMPPLQGLLVSRDEDAFLAIVPVEDPNQAEDTVTALRTLANNLAPEGTAVHVGGVATMNARLAEQVSRDTVVFLPAALVTITVFLFIALRRARAIVAPLVVVALSALAAVGSIGLADARYYLITTALPVVVMAIAVADSIHLTLAYQRRRGSHPDEARTAAMTKAVAATWLPIVLTTLTTALGFLGLAWASPVKPIAEFGLFAAVGTAAACLLSLTFLPAAQLRLADIAGGAFRPSVVDPFLARLASTCIAHPRRALSLSAAAVLIAALCASAVRFDYDRRNYFTAGEGVLEADRVLGERFVGANVLDIVIDTGAEEGALSTSTLRRIFDLQRAFTKVEGVRHVRSYADSLTLMHERLTGAGPSALPERDGAAAQYMFLYEASGDPSDFDEQLDFMRQHALLRGSLETGVFSEAEPVIARLANAVAAWEAETGLDATISGRMAVNDGWMSELRRSHARTIGAAVFFVAVATAVCVGGVRWGLIAMLPVTLGIMLLYGAMGVLRIDLAPATSMCAAIAAGLGVDFGIHLISDLRRALQEKKSLNEAVTGRYVTVMRACLFSAVSLAAGFSVVALSQTPVLHWFGLLIAFAALGSLFGALVLVPAFIGLFRTRIYAQ